MDFVRPRRSADADALADDAAQVPRQRAAPPEPSAADPPDTGTSPPGGASRSAARWRARSRGVLAVLAVLTLVAAGTQIALDAGRGPTGPGPGAAAADPAAGAGEIAALQGLSGPPTLLGRVISVPDAATAVVEVDQQPITVSVIGVDISGTPACARDEATAFARRTLVGEMVTLVPDPTLPSTGDGSTWRAYLVLGSQQSYTDLALRAGWVSAGQGRYRPGFLVGEQLARDADAGMWGPPCNRPAPS